MASLTIGPVSYRLEALTPLQVEALFPDCAERQRVLLQLAHGQLDLGSRYRLGEAVGRALCGERKDASTHE